MFHPSWLYLFDVAVNDQIFSLSQMQKPERYSGCFTNGSKIDGGPNGTQINMSLFKSLFRPKEIRIEKLLTQANSFISVIKQNKSLPKISSSIILKAGEVAVLEEHSRLFETRSVRKSVGGGAGFKLMKGLTIGGYSGQSETHQEWRELDQGKLTLTNQRLIFDGRKENRNVPLTKILSVSPNLDGFRLSLESRTKDSLFTVSNQFIWSALIRLLPQLKDPFNLEGVNLNIEFERG